MEMAAPRGRVLFFGGLPKGTTTIDFPSNVLHYREVAVLGSYASRYRDQVQALDMLEQNTANIRGVVTDVVPLDEAPEAFPRIRAARRSRWSSPRRAAMLAVELGDPPGMVVLGPAPIDLPEGHPAQRVAGAGVEDGHEDVPGQEPHQRDGRQRVERALRQAAAHEKEREARRIEDGEAERGEAGVQLLAGVEAPDRRLRGSRSEPVGDAAQPVAVARLGGRELHGGRDEGGAVGPPEEKREPRDEERRAADVDVDDRLVGVPVVRHLRAAEEDRGERRGHQPVRGPLGARESENACSGHQPQYVRGHMRGR